MMQKDNRTIAFVCTGNTCRSPMAEAIFNDMAEKNGVCVRAESFGIATSTGLPVSENSVIACKEIGIDLSGKASTAVADAGIEKYEKILLYVAKSRKNVDAVFSCTARKNRRARYKRSLRRRH